MRVVYKEGSQMAPPLRSETNSPVLIVVVWIIRHFQVFVNMVVYISVQKCDPFCTVTTDA